MPEAAERNNCVRTDVALVVGPAGADLRLDSTFFPDPTVVSAGGSITSGDRVTNIGTTAAAPFEVKCLLSRDTTVSADDVLLTGGRDVPGLAAQTSSSAGGVVLGVPATTAAGPYHLFACADYAQAVAESDESNNCLQAAPTITVTGLHVEMLPATYGPLPAEVAAGGSFPFTFGTANRGTTASPATVTTVSMQRFFAPGPTDPELGRVAVPALAPNRSVSSTLTVTVSTGTAPGRYQMRWCVDATQVAAEPSEEHCGLTQSFDVSA